MRVTFAHLCDYASISQEGKLSVMGIFDLINAVSFPMVHPMMHLAFELELRPAELGQAFTMELRLVDSDGQQIFGMRGMGNFQVQIPGGEVLHVPRVVALGGVPLTKPGSYSLDIFVNGDHKHAATFQVIASTPPAPPAPTAPPGPGLPQ